MDQHEMDNWVGWASVESIHVTRETGIAAHDDWCERIRWPAELAALAPFCRDGSIYPRVAAAVAASAAIETAIVCSIWPEAIDEVLRPSQVR